MNIALAGNPNCGKTTLFNRLTGSNRHVGNFPGVTVELNSGEAIGYEDCRIVDLPGIYSLLPYSGEEIVARDYILDGRPDALIGIVDATSIERGLYLMLQLLETDVPTVLALNMMDELRGNGGSVDVDVLSDRLGIPVVPISAAKNEGVAELMRIAYDMARKKQGPVKTVSFASEREPDRYAALADKRYRFIDSICRDALVRAEESREQRRSDRIDKLLTGKYTAFPAFLLIMAFIFWMTFSVLGQRLCDLLAAGIDALTEAVAAALTSCGLDPTLQSLVIDGVFTGVGSVLSFLPIILVLFFFLSLLEDSGYMARVAFITDKPLRRIGLSGRSFVPMLIGFGCSVPAIMATRTLSSERNRKMTALLVPFMSCSAKIPIYAVLTAAFFPDRGGLVMTLLYLFGILMAILTAKLLNKTTFTSDSSSFILELPSYRLPSLKSVVRLMWDKARDFLSRAFTVIFVATVILWFLQHFDVRLKPVSPDSTESLLAVIGLRIAPLFGPLGFADWRVATALVTGLMAKEAVISTMSILIGVGIDSLPAVLSGVFTLRSAVAFLVFALLYTPCVAAIGAMRRELGSAIKTMGIVLWQCMVAWLTAWLIYIMLGVIL